MGGHPEPITSPEQDRFHRRAQCLYDLEKTLMAFLTNLFVGARLDNPTLNLAQPSLVPFDPTLRAQALDLKVPPQIVRGSIPRTVTGEILVDRLPDVPAILIRTLSAQVRADLTIVTVQLCFITYDENPNGSGYQDGLNMIEAAGIALTSFGQQGIDQAYPIVMPIDWKLLDVEGFSHFIGEMTTQWQLPSGRPLPDSETFGIVPAEHIEFRTSAESPQVLFDGN
jgi:hypothetical protein